jgi:Family of unknown function (DUF6230)
MKDTSGAQVLGRTSWKRLGIVMVPTLAAAGALTVLMANGAIAASFAVSGQQFQLTAGSLTGQGFVQYGSIDQDVNGKPLAVAVSAFKTATITNLCQSVSTDLGPYTGGLLGTYTITLKADGAQASNLVIDMQQLKASEADFTDINIGQDASTLSGSATGAQGQSGLFGQQAGSATLTNVAQVANATNAGTFDLQNMSLAISSGGTGCIS